MALQDIYPGLLPVDGEAWDCDPEALVLVEAYDADLDEEDDEGDWQVIALERFSDRDMVCDTMTGRGDPTVARCW